MGLLTLHFNPIDSERYLSRRWRAGRRGHGLFRVLAEILATSRLSLVQSHACCSAEDGNKSLVFLDAGIIRDSWWREWNWQ